MGRKQLRQALASRAVFIGCQFCGETNKTLQNWSNGKICPECLKRKKSGAQFWHWKRNTIKIGRAP